MFTLHKIYLGKKIVGLEKRRRKQKKKKEAKGPVAGKRTPASGAET